MSELGQKFPVLVVVANVSFAPNSVAKLDVDLVWGDH